MDAGARRLGEVVDVVAAEHDGGAEVVHHELHEAAGLLDLGGVVGARVEHRARAAPRQRLQRHEVDLRVVHDAEPRAEQKGNQMLVGGTEGLDETETREREMFYLTTHSTHFIYGYMASQTYG